MSDHQQWMQRAIEEARKGVGRTSPNPPVGAVIVRDGVEIGAGWHRQAGVPHAEREAIAAVREQHGAEALRGATIYVSLEPCSTQGRTPACTDGILEAGITRVVYAACDPNPKHAGRADAILAAEGVEVISGVMTSEAEPVIRPFAKVQRCGLPWVILKTAMTLDGRLTRPPGEGMWLTRPLARTRVQQLRAEVDAILSSGETVRRDRPRLDIREPDLLRGRLQPWRVIMTDRPESLPDDAPLFQDGHSERTLLIPRTEPEAVLRKLVSEHGVCSVMLECGGRLAGAFIDAALVDEVVAFLAPMLSGGPVTSIGGTGLEDGLKLVDARFDQVGPDVMMRAMVDQATKRFTGVTKL